MIISGRAEIDEIKAYHPLAIILSGGPNSVYDSLAPKMPSGLLQYQTAQEIPMLGICYGMQLIVQEKGGVVSRSEKREYGRTLIKPLKGSELMTYSSPFNVWMSHGDKIEQLPTGFDLVAKSESGVPAAIEDSTSRIFALQFHPEVAHTENGKQLLMHFLDSIVGAKPNWTMKNVYQEQLEKIREEIGDTEHVICALSGGVDSAVAACLVHEAVGDRLHCAFVDNGLLRYQERERVLDLFDKHLHLPVTCIDAGSRFLGKLKGVSDPERKRKIIGAEFINAFDHFSKDLARKLDRRPKFLVQGTLYPDVIESAGGAAFTANIKSHHNVGGLPSQLNFSLIEPLRDLFKDEVRRLGAVMKVPDEFLKRHPFPGPGLAVRIIDTITEENVKILQLADEIFIQSIKDAGLYDKIWQAFAVLLPVKSVGVQGDSRTHDQVIALRAVTSTDGMTADWFHFDPKFLAKVSNRISNEVKGVNRVVYDISSKPPATIEWE
jgi:GMP synthase (glutamine-hydrolysing)